MPVLKSELTHEASEAVLTKRIAASQWSRVSQPAEPSSRSAGRDKVAPYQPPGKRKVWFDRAAGANER